MRQSGQKVHGPYPHRNKWRLVVQAADGSREYLAFSTEGQAKARKAALLKEIAGRTVSDAVQEFVVDRRESGLRAGTVKVSEFRLRAFFQLDAEVDGRMMPYAETGGRIDDLRPKTCEELYREMVKTCAVDTHRNALAEAKTFGAWCVKRGWIATNPLAEVTGVGQRNRGKKQLRIDEARKLVDVCLRKANEGDEAAVGVLTAFLLGLRASEVTDRVVRDLDDNGRLLWIEFGKTRRARRTLEVPALLRPYLLALARGRAPDAQLISRTISRHTGKKRDRYWLAHHVERLCTDAGVPVVCTQSLRGLHASVATEAGATSHVVASALGHSSPAVTHAHYIDGDTARRTRTRRVIGTVAPDPALRVVGDEPATAATATRSPRGATLRASSNAAVPALDVVGDEPTGAATTTSTAPRKPARRGSHVAAEPALRVVRGESDNAGATASEPTSSGDYVGNGQ